MTALECANYYVAGGDVVPGVPWVEPGDDLPDFPAQGERWFAAIDTFPTPTGAKVLWGATVEQLVERDWRNGGNTVTVTVPAEPVSMRCLGSRISGALTQAGGYVYDIDDAIGWELLIGSNADGKVRYRFVVRDVVEVSGGYVRINAVGWMGGITGDRVIGAPTRKNLLEPMGNSSFQLGNLSGWSIVTPAGRVPCGAVASASETGLSAVVTTGGLDGRYRVGLKGVPDGDHYLEVRVPFADPNERPWGRQRIGATAYVLLPTGVDIETFGLLGIAVLKSGEPFYPYASDYDPNAAKVDGSYVRGSWVQSPVEAYGYVPTPPFDATLIVKLYPTDEDSRTWFDGVQLIRRENTATDGERDLIAHPVKLFQHAQSTADPGHKSPWGITVQTGTPTGIREQGTWNHGDAQSLNEALEAIAGRGVDLYDKPGPGRVVMSTARRGSRRTDIQINPWDVLGQIRWQVDPGAQRTTLRATSAASSLWGGSDEGVEDKSQTGGQVIDVVVSGPVGMTPNQLQAWAKKQLAAMTVVQATTTILVPWSLGWRIKVGDSLRVTLAHGSAGLSRWMTVTGRTVDFQGRIVGLDLGTEVR